VTDSEGSEHREREAVEAAYAAAEDVVFSRLDRSAVTDLDISVSVTDGVLEVDVYLDADGADATTVADDAALAARAAADEVLGGRGSGEQQE
jgi:hypothetical protein